MTEIIHKRGRGEPTPDAFAEVGELAIDIESGRVYTLTEANTVVCVGSENPGGGDGEYLPVTRGEYWIDEYDNEDILIADESFVAPTLLSNQVTAKQLRVSDQPISSRGGVNAHVMYGFYTGAGSITIENLVFGGINVLGLDQVRPEDLPFEADDAELDEAKAKARSIQHAFTVTHERMGRTVEIDKEGIIRALDLQSIRGNQLFVKPSDVAEAFTTLQKALSDEVTLEGVKSALTNSLGGLIEKFEAMQSAVTQEASDE